MINFVIYEESKNYRSKYVSIILKNIGRTKYAYKILELDKYDNKIFLKIDKLHGLKIFILDINVLGKSGLDLAKEIRNRNDYNSFIIISTKCDHLMMQAYQSKLLIFDYISKHFDLENRLTEAINKILEIIDKKKCLKIKYNGDLYHIPYKDILYIIKPHNQLLTKIVTRNQKMEVNINLKTLYNELNISNMFYKMSRNCIINISNITTYQTIDNIIIFNNVKVKLECKSKKKELIDKINNYNIIDEKVNL